MKKQGNLSLIIIGVAVIAAIGLIALGRPAQGVTELPGQTFVTEATQKQATIIDVRTPSEYAAGNLAGAININLQGKNFAANIATLDTAGTYFVYCHSGNRSGQVVSYMQQHGFKKLYELTGGLMSNPSLPLVTANAA